MYEIQEYERKYKKNYAEYQSQIQWDTIPQSTFTTHNYKLCILKQMKKKDSNQKNIDELSNVNIQLIMKQQLDFSNYYFYIIYIYLH